MNSKEFICSLHSTQLLGINIISQKFYVYNWQWLVSSIAPIHLIVWYQQLLTDPETTLITIILMTYNTEALLRSPHLKRCTQIAYIFPPVMSSGKGAACLPARIFHTGNSTTFCSSFPWNPFTCSELAIDFELCSGVSWATTIACRWAVIPDIVPAATSGSILWCNPCTGSFFGLI